MYRVPARPLRRLLLIVGLGLFSPPGSLRAQGTPAAGGARDSLVLRGVAAVDARLAAAEARGDTASLRALYTPDYLAVAPDGEMLNARARLFRIARGFRSTDSIQVLTAPWVRRIGPGEVLVTQSVRLWGVRHGAAAQGTGLRVTKLYVERGGEWRIAFQQGTPLADEHIAGSGPGAPPH